MASQAPQSLSQSGEGQLQWQWEWSGDGLTWCSYEPSISAKIDSAFKAGKTSIDFRVSKSSYNIRFQSLGPRQMNLSTGCIRHVRRVETQSEGSNVTWLWYEKEKQSWHPYDSRLCARIEEKWIEKNDSVALNKENAPSGLLFVIQGQAYCLEFETDAVQFNKKTGFPRGVRRRKVSLSNEAARGVNQSQHLLASGTSTVESRIPQASGTNAGNGTRHILQGNVVVQDDQRSLGSAEDSVLQGLTYNPADIVDCTNPPENDNCCICLSSLQEKRPVMLAKCRHYFHKDCIESWFTNRPTCPECLTIYGTIMGTQPNGNMNVQYIRYGSQEAKHGLEGYPNIDVIKITYTFPNGIQKAEHPNPGKPYTGTVRNAYLPKNTEGEEVLELLKRAWNQRLLFRIGTSLTTGRTNTVVWAGIHHKTHMDGGSSNHGYPDETYFARVKAELKEVGVF